jgi:hypothetical protein
MKMPKQSTVLQAIVLLVVVFYCMDGRYSICPSASPVERVQILKTLEKYEKDEQLNREAMNLRHAGICKCGKTAWARYSVSSRSCQFIWPVEVKLSKSGGQWEVVSEKDKQPWWWHVVNRTIGVK